MSSVLLPALSRPSTSRRPFLRKMPNFARVLYAHCIQPLVAVAPPRSRSADASCSTADRPHTAASAEADDRALTREQARASAVRTSAKARLACMTSTIASAALQDAIGAWGGRHAWRCAVALPRDEEGTRYGNAMIWSETRRASTDMSKTFTGEGQLTQRSKYYHPSQGGPAGARMVPAHAHTCTPCTTTSSCRIQYLAQPARATRETACRVLRKVRTTFSRLGHPNASSSA